MINIDAEKYLIELTRGDNAVIEFGAVDDDDNAYLPVVGDVLVFAVGKKRNAAPIFQIENEFGKFSAVSPTEEEFNADKTSYFIYDGEYERCTEESVYDSSEVYYKSDFWDIEILPKHTAEMKSGMNYVWDLQLESNGEIHTIIGETDSLNPKFKAWGEVAQ